MTTQPEPPALSHIEKSLSEAYRKEIDQEENVWRTLPFFAAALALQLSALFQLVERMPEASSCLGKIAVAFLSLAATSSLTALVFLIFCIWPQKFQYLAPEPEMLEYAKGLIEDEANSVAAKQVPVAALTILKEAMAFQYAVGTHHNRGISKYRERQRLIAGLATVASVIFTLLLVAVAFIPYATVPRSNGHVRATESANADLGTQGTSLGREGDDNIRPPNAER